LRDKATPPYKYKVHGRLRCPTHTIVQKTNLLPLFYPNFLSTSPHSSSALHGWWINDGEALERPIATACPNGVPPGHVGFRVSRDLTGVSCVSHPRRGSSGDMSCVSPGLALGRGGRDGSPPPSERMGSSPGMIQVIGYVDAPDADPTHRFHAPTHAPRDAIMRSSGLRVRSTVPAEQRRRQASKSISHRARMSPLINSHP